MKKFFTPLNLIFSLEVIITILAATGLIPREAILVWTGLAVFYMIFSPVRDSLWLVVVSIPLYAALPLADNFDTPADWRILIAVLLLCLFFKEGLSLRVVKNEAGRWQLKETLKHYTMEYLAAALLAFGALSVGVADYKILAVKKLLFLINIFLLFIIVRNKTRNKEDIVRVWQAAAVGAVASIAVALAQFGAVIFVPLIDFWNFWARSVIDFFYGHNLADLLSISNTWFAYYNAAPPTLRLFSVFPDSHSFALFSLLSVPVFLGLAFYYRQRKGWFWAAAALALLGAVFSGSRGVWLSAIPAALAALFLWFKEKDKTLLGQAVTSFALFAAIFFVSSFWPPIFYKVQEWQTGQYSPSAISFFERAKSISNLEEASNKGRLEIWRDSLLSIGGRPLLGVGLGNFISVLGEEVAAAKKGASAHNLYLDVAAEIGLPGLLILLLMFADILRTSWLVWQKAREPYFRLFGLIFWLYFIWTIGYSFFDVVLLNDKVLLFFVVGLATLYSLRNIIFDPKTIWRR